MVSRSGAHEEMFFFPGTRGRNLLGFLHHAPRPSPAGVGLVYCHPFAEEKNQSHSIVARAARRFALAGLPVLRFDFSCCGDSEGEFADGSADDWLGDIALAASELRARTGAARIGYWGLRAGANLAALRAVSSPDAAFAMLWQPLPDLRAYANQFLRQKLASGIAAGDKGVSVKGLVEQLDQGGVIEVMGYPVSKTLYASLASRNAGPGSLAYPCPVGIFTFGEEEPPMWAASMASALEAGKAAATFGHVRAEPFWDRYWRWNDAAVESCGIDWMRSLP